MAKEFNDAVSMDLKIYDQKKGIYFQHLIDHRTRFSTSKVIYSKNKETLIESIFTHWIAIFGRPYVFLSDNGGEYNNEHFIDMCDKLGVHVITTGAEAAWSNGIVERHHALLSRNVKKIVEDTGCSIETALAWAVNAKNELSNINGYSPYQLLLGINPKIPSINDPYEKLPTLEEETPSECLAEHIKAIYSARKEQMACEMDEKIRRALSHKTRDVCSKEVKHGDHVYYKRDGCDRWKGPATVIGIDKKIVFLRHGGFQIKCHICRVVNVNEVYNKSGTGSDSPPNDDNKPECDEFSEARKAMFEEVEQSNCVINDPVALSVDDEMPCSVNVQLENSPDEQCFEYMERNEALKIQKLCDTKSSVEKKQVSVLIKNNDPFKNEKQAEIQKGKIMRYFKRFVLVICQMKR